MQHFDQELAALKEKLLTMASHVESAVNRGVTALSNRDADLAQQVRDDDEIVDQLEVEIDELAIHLLAKAPLASDLRLITIAMKICQNLERVGDEATKIAKRVQALCAEAPLKLDIAVPRLADAAIELLRCALDAFVHNDSAAARQIIPRDREVDALNREIHQELTRHMEGDPQLIGRCLHYMVIAKSLERIADHGKNVAEEVVYLREALDIRHTAATRPPAA